MATSGAESVDRLVLDTSSYSGLRRGHAAVLDWIASAVTVQVPVTVLGELEAAFELGSRPDSNRQALADFVAEPYVVVLETTRNVARRYGTLFARLRRAGTPVPVNDLWIAAATLEVGGHLLTFDRDFARIPDLRCTVLPA